MAALNSFVVNDSNNNLAVAPEGQTCSKSMVWTNNTGKTLYVTIFYVWLGISDGDKGDASYVLYNATQSIVYDDGNDDHYGVSPELTGRKEWSPNLSPDWLQINPGDQVILGFTANADDMTPLVEQAYARLYYRLG